MGAPLKFLLAYVLLSGLLAPLQSHPPTLAFHFLSGPLGHLGMMIEKLGGLGNSGVAVAPDDRGWAIYYGVGWLIGAGLACLSAKGWRTRAVFAVFWLIAGWMNIGGLMN
ncbi:MAG: hypothetical protein EOP83_30530 [Verrucomicrobiaceae bacterium]|nr:MAG: hypothetical protein EOP83_30530 [Verrucomicrobiaceae bacterium]